MIWFLILLSASAINAEDNVECKAEGIVSMDNDEGYTLCWKAMNGTFLKTTTLCPTGTKYFDSIKACGIQNNGILYRPSNQYQAINNQAINNPTTSSSEFGVRLLDTDDSSSYSNNSVAIGDKCFDIGQFKCNGCRYRSYCWDKGFGKGPEVIEIQECHKDQICSPYTNKCSFHCLSGWDEAEFECTSTAMFPDPYSCEKHHFCASAGLPSVAIRCPKNQYYDPLHMHCVDFEVHGEHVCPPTEKCDSDRQTRAVKRNPQFYYKCFKISHNYYKVLMLKCPRMGYFDGKECKEKADNTNKQSPTTSTPTTTKYQTTTSK